METTPEKTNAPKDLPSIGKSLFHGTLRADRILPFPRFPESEKEVLDMTLDAGTYWVQVDGYAGEQGTWFLDVRVLDP